MILFLLLTLGASGPLVPPKAPVLPPAAYLPLPPWSPNIDLIPQPESQSQNETSVAQQGFRLVAAWNDYRGNQGVTVGVAYSRSAGTQWSPNAFPLENSPYPEEGDPVVTFVGRDTVLLVGIAFDRNNGVGDIVLSRSFNGGQTWEPVENLTNTPNDFDDKCWISAYHDTVLVTYTSFGYPVGIQLLVSTDAGETWQGPVHVNWSGNGAIPRMDAQGRLFVLWGLDSPSSGAYTAGIWLKVSEDLGQTFGPLRWVANLTPDTLLPWRAPALPAFQVDRHTGALYVAYSRLVGDSSRIYFKRSLDGGTSFEPPVVPVAEQPGHQIFPALTVDPEGRVHLFYLRVRQENTAWLVSAWHTVSEDSGATWQPATMVSDTEAAPAWDVFIGDYMEAVSNQGFVGVVWPQRGPFSDDVWFSRQVLDTLSPTVFLTYAWDTVRTGETLTVHLAYGNPADVAVVHLLLMDSLGAVVDTVAEVLGPETLATWMPSPDQAVSRARLMAVARDVAWNAGVDTGPTFEVIVSVAESWVAEQYLGLRVWPNPFQDRVFLQGVRARLEVWDAQGRLVQRIGPGTRVWDGTGFQGRPLPPGVYFLRPAGARWALRLLKLR